MARVTASLGALVCALSLLLSACSASQASGAGVPTMPATALPSATALPPTPTSAPTAIPTPTPPPPLAANLFVAGVDVGSLAPEAARAKIEQELAPLLRPIDVRVEQEQTTLTADDIKLQLDLDTMLAA
ncbi:MAG TPA: hypothetical protein VFT99_06800, partial [Roseiflexaceae bacterium]|nr:hypothetical protein [Roseiflexaceae bacterium]